jgi:recombinational DNA repair protein (RecF pathway)
MTNSFKGIILYKKIIKDNDIYIKILASNDQIITGMVYGGNSSKKKLIYQNGFFIEFMVSRKNENFPLTINAEICKPFLSNMINDKYKLNALLSILSLIKLSITEGQNIKGLYIGVENLLLKIIFLDHWIVFYCEWLFYLLQLIGYQIDYKKNSDKNFFDLVNQIFVYESNENSIIFPHELFFDKRKINQKNLHSIFYLFENVFTKNHLESVNYKMPINFLNFKKIILKRL